MKKFILLLALLPACGHNISGYDCREMCKPRLVDRLDKDGCFCEGSQKAKP